MAREPVIAHVALGANLGNAVATVQAAAQALGELPGCVCEACSPLYASPPLEAASGPDFINAVARLRTTLTAPALLQALLDLEQRFGRKRPWHHAPRTLDLDLLSYGSARIDSPRLTVPHPRMAQRAFVLRPLADLDPAAVSAQALVAVAAQPVRRLETSHSLSHP